MRFLIVKMSSMGDVVHAQPLASDLKRAFPLARIDWVVERPFAAICALNPAIDRVLPIAWRRWRRRLGDPLVRADMRAFRDALRETVYDEVFDCQGLIKSALVVRLSRARRRNGPDWRSAREPLASLAYDRRVAIPRDWHVIRRNRAVGALSMGYPMDPADIAPLAASPPDPQRHDWWPSQPTVVLITGASREPKLWPEPHWQAVAAHLQSHGLRIVWLWGSEAERERAQRLAASAPGSIVPPFLSVADAASVLGAARGVIGLDTGFTHLAAALGVATVGIFCDFDAVQCAVTGPAPCESLGGIGQVPAVAQVIASADRCLGL